MVEVITAEVGVAVGRLHFEYAVAEFEDGDIECTAAEVEYSDFLVFVGLVKAVGKSGCRRFVDDTANGEAGDFACFLGGLTLGVVEVCGDGDDGFGHFLSEVVFGGLLHLLENHCRDFLRSVFATVDSDTDGVVLAADYLIRYAFDFVDDFVVLFAHETLDRVDGAFGVGDGLTFCGVAHFAFAAIDECYYRRSGVATFAVGDDNGVVAFKNGNA